MDRDTFYRLYVNLNSLVELGLQRRAAQLLASLPDPPAAPELTPEEAEARMMKAFENMDMSALDQVWENLGNMPPPDAGQMGNDAPLAAAGRADLPAPEVGPEAAAGEDGLPDLEGYMRRAYTYEDVLRERIDRLFAKADLATMSRQVEQLGGTPPLTATLDGAGMAAWLDRYEREEAVLTDLATQMRRLEMQG